MKKLYIICDGGLGNHVNGMISGLALAEKLNRIPIVVWPITNECQISYYDIWEKSKLQLVESTISNFFKNILTESYDIISYGMDRLKSFPFIDDTKITRLISNIDESIYKLDITNDNLVYYYCRKIKPFLWDKSGEKLCSLKIKKHISDYVKDFIDKNKISPQNTNGMHIRLTDSNRTLDPSYLENIIKSNQNLTFYVCSCSKDMEDTLKIYKNVIINPKKEYGKKLNEGDWRDYIIDEDGRRKPANVFRSKESIFFFWINNYIFIYF
jgi:hypothetical protein